MAKNKNRKQGGEQSRSSQAEQAQEQARSAASDAQSAIQSQAQGSPADVARKHQRRFGHN
ncbi:Small hydrophilic protein OS=Streptomyces alboniger OX=132473 GN=CP975_08995 PE=4 SV=1 [Streptomyces alboniger]